jgi:hypothetical protein
MTISEIAAQMGVPVETLVQEVVAQGTTKAMNEVYGLEEHHD